MIIFKSVKAGSNFAIFEDSRNKFFGFGNCEYGELQNPQPKQVKKLRNLNMKYKNIKLFPERLIVGKNNCILIDGNILYKTNSENENVWLGEKWSWGTRSGFFKRRFYT